MTAQLTKTTETYPTLHDAPFYVPVLAAEGKFSDAPGIYLDEHVSMSDDGQTHAPAGWEMLYGYGSHSGVFSPAHYISERMSAEIAQECDGQIVVLAEVLADFGKEDEADLAEAYDFPAGWAILTRPA